MARRKNPRQRPGQQRPRDQGPRVFRTHFSDLEETEKRRDRLKLEAEIKENRLKASKATGEIGLSKHRREDEITRLKEERERNRIRFEEEEKVNLLKAKKAAGETEVDEQRRKVELANLKEEANLKADLREARAELERLKLEAEVRENRLKAERAASEAELANLKREAEISEFREEANLRGTRTELNRAKLGAEISKLGIEVRESQRDSIPQITGWRALSHPLDEYGTHAFSITVWTANGPAIGAPVRITGLGEWINGSGLWFTNEHGTIDPEPQVRVNNKQAFRVQLPNEFDEVCNLDGPSRWRKPPEVPTPTENDLRGGLFDILRSSFRRAKQDTKGDTNV